MIAYKFLAAGRVAPLSGHVWPEDGSVEAIGSLETCRNGVHACRVEDLPYWLDDELWEVELDGEIVEDRLKLVARRGRLVRRIEAWDDDARGAFAVMCLRRAAAHASAELRAAALDAEAAALEAAEQPDQIGLAAHAAAEAARAAGAAAAERLAAYAEDAVGWAAGYPPSGVAYVAAHVADSRTSSESADPFAVERELQARWLAERLRLSPGAA